VAVGPAPGKKLIGAFFPPLLGVSDISTLRTFSPRGRGGGMGGGGEGGPIAGARATPKVGEGPVGVGRSARPPRPPAGGGRSAGIKVRIVSRDERESGERMLLNFGHTIGHALESATGYGPIRHGEAVVAGMHAAIAVSVELGRCSSKDAARAVALLRRFPRPP